MALEALLAEQVGTSLATLLIRSVTGAAVGMAGASLTKIAQSLVKDYHEQKQLARHFERIGERIAQELEPRFERSAQTDVVDVAKVASAVGHMLGQETSAIALLQYNMEPERLVAAWRETHPEGWENFKQEERLLYERVLEDSSRYVVEVAAELPGFQSQYVERAIRELGSVTDDLDRILSRVDEIERWVRSRAENGQVDRYEADYRRAVIRRFDYMELLGVDIPSEARRHPLSVAFVSLSLWTNSREPTQCAADAPFVSRPFECILSELLGTHHRLLIRGEAGSGKSTLFRWAALQAALPSSDPKMADVGDDWRAYIPFLVRLRDFPHGKLPHVADLPTVLARHVASPPGDWVQDRLVRGGAILLFDGVDEVPNRRRDEVRHEIEQIIDAYPDNLFLVSTRPAAVPAGWLAAADFREAVINPMSDADRSRFIQKWHDAVREQLRRERRLSQDEDFDTLAQSLAVTLRENPSMARLATNPLLCGVLCALHRERRTQLPATQIELCEDLCRMLLYRRDRESGLDLGRAYSTYSGLNYEQKRAAAQELAHYMVRNGQSAISTEQADACLREVLSRFAASQANEECEVRRGLVERSGLLRESEPDRIDFIHNTLKEYLAGDRFASLADVGQLADHALDPAWQPSIMFAAASRNVGFADRLIDRMLAIANSPLARARGWLGSADTARVLKLFAVRCGSQALHLSQHNRERLTDVLESDNRPLSTNESEAFASLGDFVVPFLEYAPDLPERTAVACLRTLRLIGTPKARECLRRYCIDVRKSVVSELTKSLGYDEVKTAPEALPAATVVATFFRAAGCTITVDASSDDLRIVNAPPQLVDYIPIPLAINESNTVSRADIENLAEKSRRPGERSVAFLIYAHTPDPLTRTEFPIVLSKFGVSVIPLDLKAIRHRIRLGEDKCWGLLDQALKDYGPSADLFGTTGPITDSMAFFGRSEILNTLRNAIERGQSVGLFGLRKSGKTSLLNHLAVSMTDHAVVQIDLEGRDSQHFASSILGEILEQLRVLLASRQVEVGEAPLFPEGASGDVVAPVFVSHLRKLCNNLIAAKLKGPVLVLLDEVERVLPRSGDPRDKFLDFNSLFGLLRRLSQQDRIVSLIVADLHPNINRVNYWPCDGIATNPVFAFFKEVFMPPMTLNETRDMLIGIGRLMGRSFDRALAERIHLESGGHPLLSRQIASVLLERNPDELHLMVSPQVEEVLDGLFDLSSFVASYLEQGMWDDIRITGPVPSCDILKKLVCTVGPVSDSCLARCFRDEFADTSLRAAVTALKQYGLLERTGPTDEHGWTIRPALFSRWLRMNMTSEEAEAWANS